MSPVIESQQPSLLERLSLVNVVVGLIMAVGGVGVSVWSAQAVTTNRLGTLESDIKESKQARNKQIEGIEQKIDDLRERAITREEFKDYLTELKESVSELRSDVRELRADGRKR